MKYLTIQILITETLKNAMFYIPDSTGHPMDIHFISILRPHVHRHEMNIHRTSDLRHPLMANIWTSTRCPVLDVKVSREHARMC